MWRVSVGGWLRNMITSLFYNQGRKNRFWWCWHRLAAFCSRHTATLTLKGSNVVWKFPHTTQTNRHIILFQTILVFQSSHLFMTLSIVSTFNALLPLHLLCHHDSATGYFYTVQIIWKLLLCSVLSVFDVLCISETTVSVLQSKTGAESRINIRIDEVKVFVWLMLGIRGVTGEEGNYSLQRKLEQAPRHGHLPFLFIVSLT